MLEISESSMPGYWQRTVFNAKHSDLTIALALDFSTAGENLTREAAGSRYIAIQLQPGLSSVDASNRVIQAIRKHHAKKLNVAGNGIYTLNEKRYITQHTVNRFVYRVLARAFYYTRFSAIRSGGQTGIDFAGLVAGYKLGILTEAYMPKDFLRLAVDKTNYRSTESKIRAEIEKYASRLTDYEILEKRFRK